MAAMLVFFCLALETTPAVATPPVACEPACRPGFVCIAGECRSRCNPPCAAGEVCTDNGLCDAGVDRWGPGASRAAWTVDRQERAAARQLEARNERLAARSLPRLTLGAGFAFGGQYAKGPDQPTTFGPMLSVGYRQSVTPYLGFELKATPFFGVVTVQDGERCLECERDDDDTYAVDLALVGGLYFGPFGRFYFGPIAGASHRFFGKDRLSTTRAHYDIERRSALQPIVGGEAGILLGGREQMDLKGQLRVDVLQPAPIFIAFFTYHLM